MSRIAATTLSCSGPLFGMLWEFRRSLSFPCEDLPSRELYTGDVQLQPSLPLTWTALLYCVQKTDFQAARAATLFNHGRIRKRWAKKKHHRAFERVFFLICFGTARLTFICCFLLLLHNHQFLFCLDSMHSRSNALLKNLLGGFLSKIPCGLLPGGQFCRSWNVVVPGWAADDSVL